jgi:hypothetical protein
LSSSDEQGVEGVASPLDAVLDKVGEISHGAHGNGLLWWILRITVTKCLVWNNHLRVGFGSESAGLQERLLVPDTLLINIESSLDIINSIDNKV